MAQGLHFSNLTPRLPRAQPSYRAKLHPNTFSMLWILQARVTTSPEELPPVDGKAFWLWISLLAVGVDKPIGILTHGHLIGLLCGGACCFSFGVHVTFWS